MSVSRPGVIGLIWKNIKKTLLAAKQAEQYIGKDDYGNRYYEKLADPEKELKRQRRVESTDPDLAKVPDVPVEWMTWLQGRRHSPPTTEEIQKNYVTLAKTLYRAQELEDSRADEDLQSDMEKKEEISKPSNTGQKFPVYSGFEVTPGDSNTRIDEKK